MRGEGFKLKDTFLPFLPVTPRFFDNHSRINSQRQKKKDFFCRKKGFFFEYKASISQHGFLKFQKKGFFSGISGYKLNFSMKKFFFSGITGISSKRIFSDEKKEFFSGISGYKPKKPQKRKDFFRV